MLKKLLAFSMFLCASGLLHAQETASKFSISPFFAPTITGNIVSKEPSYYSSAPRPGYSAGVLGTYAFNKRVSLQTGVAVSRLSYQEDGWDSPGYEPDKIPVSTERIFRFHYIDVPLQVKYTFLKKKKISIYAVAGVETNFLANTNFQFISHFDDGSKAVYENNTMPDYYRRVNFSLTSGIGMDVELTSRVSWFLQINYRQMLLPVESYAIKKRPFSFGFMTGVRIKL